MRLLRKDQKYVIARPHTQKKMGYNVMMTGKKDCFIPLHFIRNDGTR